jgi:hemolysin activation/secretion protein
VYTARRRILLRRVAFAIAFALATLTPLAPRASRAQPVPPRPPSRGLPFEPLQRPGEIRPEAPAPAPPEEPGFVLPPLPVPGEGERLSGGPQIVVREFRVTGSTVFSEAALAAVTAPYVGHPIGTEKLDELRDRLTRLYIDAGYLNSGAVLPDQDVREGVVEFQIVEGRLSDLSIEGNRWFRSGYLERRIRRGAHTPLDVKDLENELQLLQQDPRIRRVDAELVPGERPGEARLQARFEEALPFFISLEASNYESPSVGAYRGEVNLGNRNLVGFGDTLRGMGAWTEGLQEYEAGYEIPVTSYDTTVGAWYYYGKSDVVENPFDALDIDSWSQTVGLELRQPVYRTLATQIDLAMTGEWRKSRNYLGGDPFSFSEGTDDGRAVVSVLRFRQDFVYRDLRQAVAARSQLSVGLDVLGATTDGCITVEIAEGCVTDSGFDDNRVPDAKFVAWLGQFQWVRRFEPWAWEAVLRTDLQISSRPLFSLEQFPVGGHASVRGYRENELVRDNGIASSIELRIPLWMQREGVSSLQLAPFADIGNSWNTERSEASPRTIASVGIGLRAQLTSYLSGQIYWGHRLQAIPDSPDDDLQDDGVQFSVTASY